nr:reverse transcriptase domain-containing protein [Tanacetum cinerariifolium]
MAISVILVSLNSSEESVGTQAGRRSTAASGALHRRVRILVPKQLIPHGRPYRYHPNGPVHMMTARKRVRPIPIHRLAVRHSIDYSSSDLFTFDDSSKTSSDSSSDDLSNSSSGHSSLDHTSPTPSSDANSKSSVTRVTSLRDDVVIRGSDEPYSEPDIDPEIQVEIDDCIAYADALRDEGIYARVVVETDVPEPTQEEGGIKGTYEALGDLVQRFHDHNMEILAHRAQVIMSIQRDQGHRIVAMDQQSVVLSERISELERDNTRLKGTLDVASQRITRLQRRETMPNTRSGATMTGEAVNELIARRVAEALEARDAARNLEPLVEGRSEQGDENGGNGGGNRNEGVNENGNGGGNGNGKDNGNGNESGGGNGYNFRDFVPVDRDALTWWNTYKRAIGIEAAYAMKWTELMKMMIEVYCPGNKIQKMETELCNLTVKGNDLTAYIRIFQELVLLCTRMILDEEDKVEGFIGGLPNNIQWNVIAAEPTRLQDAICIANNLMDQKMKGCARSAQNKRRTMETTLETRLGAMKLQQRLMPLVEEEQIPTSSW